MAIAPPIRTRIDMLTTGVRTPVGIKVFGEDLKEIERISVSLEGLLRQVPGTRSTFAERQTGREYVDIVPNREAIARYGLTVRDVQDVVEAAVGGMPVSTAIAGRARFSINLRYAADQRSDPQALRRILVPVQATGSVADLGGANTGAGASVQAGGMVASGAGGTGGGMGSMGGGGAQPGMRSGGASTSLASPPMSGSVLISRLHGAVASARGGRAPRRTGRRARDDRPANDQGRKRRARRLRVCRHRSDPARPRRLGRRCEGRRRVAARVAGRVSAAVDRPV